jgi:hypothetical protein
LQLIEKTKEQSHDFVQRETCRCLNGCAGWGDAGLRRGVFRTSCEAMCEHISNEDVRYAIRATLPHGDAAPSTGLDGLITIWLDRQFVDLLGLMRGPGESYSDVILRLAKASQENRLVAPGWKSSARDLTAQEINVVLTPVRGADDQPGVVPKLEAFWALALCRQRIRPRDRIFVRESEWQHLDDVGNVSIP